MNNLNDRFRDAVELLYKKNQYLAAEVTRLGFPTLTGNCKTAQVIWDKNKKRINFEFNKKFADGLTDEEFAFVISHEAVHIINSHIFTLLENINKFKTKSNPELMSFMKKFAIASDCIVNDSLTNLYGFEKLLNPPMDPNTGMPEIDPKTGKPKIKGLYGKEIVGFDCHDYDVMTVISMLKDQQGNNGKDGDKKKGQKQKGQGS